MLLVLWVMQDGIVLGQSCWLPTTYELPKTVVASYEPVLNKDVVILDCGASLYWEDGKVATFHCSFLANLTMDITAIGTRGTLHVHDFVIPYHEKEASFLAGTETGFNDLVTGWDKQPSKNTVTTDLPQEALLVKEFAGWSEKSNSKTPSLTRSVQLLLGKRNWYWML
ncbi:hypothetical protein AAZX31_10G207700 [Glycine max]|uniref:Uncharacterized protein n=2 Tax=Glycine subgen. Soja TaxID=1462606 RepID=A0A0R0HX50_SOYBN|nr:hypothetical protein GLYMA_10G219300v4 [Glycine max]KHN17061.1 Putative oxidoreductase [Glycine soja]KAG4397838.1 hypothetical protein GLYMA_10G219300v4 [Glycine max]KAG5004855.1 hypothetical protein JHK86_028994 [Glycine max]KAG5128037.1 hypothetical protein JHK82_028872 [Glycine max]